ncbi:MAG TPA: glycosyltransferase family 1 protein, partial [bacterium]
MKVLLVTDAWHPQVNGVVRTLSTIKRVLEAEGHQLEYVSPDQFLTVPCPTYSEIRLALNAGAGIKRRVEAFQPDAIHIATEGPLGIAARKYCLRHGLAFTTAYHTKFPEYLNARFRIPKSWMYKWLRAFHAPSAGVMVATASIRQELGDWGFTNLRQWSRGVDTDLFAPQPKGWLKDPRPISLYVGRVAVEKNIRAFLDLDIPGTKYVVGDGPRLDELRRNYPEAKFPGAKFGAELARYYADADVFVFPSKTDTFGLVLLEALASGLPVAAYPVPGPLDVIGNTGVGVLNSNLALAVEGALGISPEACREYALRQTWQRTAHQF